MGKLLGAYAYTYDGNKDNSFTISPKVLVQVLLDKTRDDCNCTCWKDGCSAFVQIFKDFAHDTEYYFQRSGTLFSCLEDAEVQSRVPSEVLRQVAKEAIRFQTFQRMELTHTCCSFGRHLRDYAHSFDEIEAKEIHSEERKILADLETLVSELTAEFLALGCLLQDFFERVWEKKMDEWDMESKEMSEEEAAGLRDLGVVLN